MKAAGKRGGLIFYHINVLKILFVDQQVTARPCGKIEAHTPAG